MIQATHKTHKKHDVMIYRDAVTPIGWFSWEVTDRKQTRAGQMKESSATKVFNHLKWKIDNNEIFPATVTA